MTVPPSSKVCWRERELWEAESVEPLKSEFIDNTAEKTKSSELYNALGTNFDICIAKHRVRGMKF
jgi:hypothetical protein